MIKGKYIYNTYRWDQLDVDEETQEEFDKYSVDILINRRHIVAVRPHASLQDTYWVNLVTNQDILVQSEALTEYLEDAS